MLNAAWLNRAMYLLSNVFILRQELSSSVCECVLTCEQTCPLYVYICLSVSPCKLLLTGPSYDGLNIIFRVGAENV